jgi:hypothetical protein
MSDPERSPPRSPAAAIPAIDLPPPDTRRWVARRKADVVNAVQLGVITLEEACARYNLSEEEFASWERLIDRHGFGALRVTHLKRFRKAPPGPGGADR